jgi:uncharacterized protein (DUF1697 family)
MSTFVALLRGINVGGAKRLPMAYLRAVCAAAGGTDVRTYIQSGNVVLRHDLGREALVASLEAAIAAKTGFAVSVVIRTAAELAQVVERCPFDTSVDPTTLVVWFSPTVIEQDWLAGVDPDAFGQERFAAIGHELYLSLPDGQARSTLIEALTKALAATPIGAVVTARNWRTVLTLLEMATTPA